MAAFYMLLTAAIAMLWVSAPMPSPVGGQSQALLKVTSLQWVSSYVAFAYFLFCLIGSYKPELYPARLRTSLYLLMTSVNLLSLPIAILMKGQKKGEDFEEEGWDFGTEVEKLLTKGGILVFCIIELGNILKFDCPSWPVLVFHDIYFVGWFCFAQYMCYNSLGSYSYKFLNKLTSNQLYSLTAIILGLLIMIQVIFLAINPNIRVKTPDPAPEKPAEQDKAQEKRNKTN
jgi:hypothetical protein